MIVIIIIIIRFGLGYSNNNFCSFKCSIVEITGDVVSGKRISVENYRKYTILRTWMKM